MSHPGSWIPKRREQVRRAIAEADGSRLREVTLHQHSAAALNGQLGPDFFRMHPCQTFRVFRFKVVATCMSCLGDREVTPHAFDESPLAHRHWPVVMGELVCPACGSCPRELRFIAERGGEVGAISIDAQIDLRIATATIGVSKPAPSRREIDPFAQHDDGETLHNESAAPGRGKPSDGQDAVAEGGS